MQLIEIFYADYVCHGKILHLHFRRHSFSHIYEDHLFWNEFTAVRISYIYFPQSKKKKM